MFNLLYIIGGIAAYKLLTMEPDKISEHITYAEAIKSRTAIKYGIPNKPQSWQLANMRLLAEKVFEPLRNHFGVPIRVNSFFRSKRLNSKLPFHSNTSQHMKGQAIDIISLNKAVSNADFFYYIKNHLDFDQLIWEFGTSKNPAWVHVSYVGPGKNRKQVLRSIIRNGEKMYVKFDL